MQIFETEEAFFDAFQENNFDLLFIDYYLEQTTGLEIANVKAIRLKDTNVIIIFVTSSRDFAIDSYKVRASGYLVKPINYGDFEETMSLIDYKQFQKNRYIELANGQAKTKIFMRDIIYCDACGHYVQIHTKSAGTHKSRISFSEFTKTLADTSEFLVCYKGCIINMDHVVVLDESAFVMVNGARIPFRKNEKYIFFSISLHFEYTVFAKSLSFSTR